MAFLTDLGGILSDTFSATGDFLSDAGSGLYDFGSSAIDFFSDEDLLGSFVSLAGDALLDGVSLWSADEAANAALKAGESAADVFYANADLLFEEASNVEQRTYDQAVKMRFQGLRLLANQQMSYLKNGVTLEGTPLMVVSETEMLIENDILTLFEQGEQAAKRLRDQAAIQEKRADNALDQGSFEAEAVMINQGEQTASRILGVN